MKTKIGDLVRLCINANSWQQWPIARLSEETYLVVRVHGKTDIEVTGPLGARHVVKSWVIVGRAT